MRGERASIQLGDALELPAGVRCLSSSDAKTVYTTTMVERVSGYQTLLCIFSEFEKESRLGETTLSVDPGIRSEAWYGNGETDHVRPYLETRPLLREQSRNAMHAAGLLQVHGLIGTVAAVHLAYIRANLL